RGPFSWLAVRAPPQWRGQAPLGRRLTLTSPASMNSCGTSAGLFCTSGVLGLRSPPLVEPAVCLLIPERALVQPQLQQECERAADHRPRRQAEVLHHLPAGAVGPD